MSKPASASTSGSIAIGPASTIPDNATEPLGFAAFVVALLFAYSARYTPADAKWMRPLIYIVAITAVFGGGFLFWTHDRNLTLAASQKAALVAVGSASAVGSVAAPPDSATPTPAAVAASEVVYVGVGTVASGAKVIGKIVGPTTFYEGVAPPAVAPAASAGFAK
jgi:hypothetical protein